MLSLVPLGWFILEQIHVRLVPQGALMRCAQSPNGLPCGSTQGEFRRPSLTAFSIGGYVHRISLRTAHFAASPGRLLFTEVIRALADPRSMLAPEDRPATHARVMKIASPSGEALPSPMPAPAPPAVAPAPLPKNESAEKVSKFEEDYAESSDEGTSATGTVEDDGWDMVPSRKKSASSATEDSVCV